ncbi:MAG: hypothetical protein QOF86_1448 [Baekduia sp.]|nr:hypothetical protein [Baekduia sp.]
MAPAAQAAVSFAPSTGSPFDPGAGAGYPTGLAAGDLNGDGRPDIATAGGSADNVAVLLGDGAGSFAPGAHSPVATGINTNPRAIAIGDVDRDGHPDLVASDQGTNQVSVLLGDGTGNFTQAPGSPFAVGTKPNSVTVGDVNGDGKPDLLTADINSNDITILLGDGTGGFTPAAGSPVSTGAATAPVSVAIGDVDGDGHVDLAITLVGANGVAILLGDGTGAFALAAGSPVWLGPSVGSLYPGAAVLGDVNGDGRLDVAVPDYGPDDVRVLLVDGAGGFGAAPGSPFAVGRDPLWVAVADVNGDGKPDLATANSNATDVSVLLSAKGGFRPAAGSPFPGGHHPTQVVVLDANGDGKPDLATAAPTGVAVLLNAMAPDRTVPAGPEAFGTVTTGQSSQQTVTVASTGDAPLHVAHAALTGADAGDFAITQDGCTGTTVALDATCDVVVRFTPQATGGRSAALRFTDDSASAGADVALSGTGAAPGGPGTADPTVRDVIAPAFLGHAKASPSKLKKSTKFSYTISEPARVIFTIQRLTDGRKVGKTCVKPTHANRKKKACTRSTRVGAFTVAAARKGANTYTFSGRLGKQRLASGRYHAVLIATDAAGNASKPATISFRVVASR